MAKRHGQVPKLAEPRYRGPGRPVQIRKPMDLPDVREGRYCGRCAAFIEPKRAAPVLEREKFWERAFHQYDDGHDLKPWMFGDLSMYGICDRFGMCAHFFSHCKSWREKREFGRIFIDKLIGKK